MRPEDKASRFIYDAIHEGCKKTSAGDELADFVATDSVNMYCKNQFESVSDLIEESIKCVEDYFAEA